MSAITINMAIVVVKFGYMLETLGRLMRPNSNSKEYAERLEKHKVETISRKDS